ncbi:uncharacterized protein LOC127131031 [Lathyrus oleraceus]|uniref:uncharacterized protein LOC127131031 n=1 Tax=Pisum sativum TaxID=3888 RepID=UPI0021D05752|nr:uncharacterized protein LOC127131031 [Pisum sativum]
MALNPWSFSSKTEDNPRAEKTLGQSSLNIAANDIVDKSIHVTPSNTLVDDPEFGVMTDVTTSLGQSNHPVETTKENSHDESDNESVPIESSEKPQEDVSEDESIGGEKDDFDDESMSVEGKNVALGIAKRLKNRKRKVVVSTSKPSKASKKSAGFRYVKEWSKVVTPATKKRSVKRKDVPLSDSEYDVEQNVQGIMPSPKKGVDGKKIPVNMPEVPTENILFHPVENVEKWKYVYQRRLALERNIGKDVLEYKEVVDLIEEAGLMIFVGFGNCYEMLVKEFIMNTSKDCDSKMSKEYMKVYVRGECVEFSPEIINRFMGRSEEEQAKVEVTDIVVCREIIVKQVKQWPRKGKLSASRLSVKYVILHRIGDANWVPTSHTSTIATGLGKFIYIVRTKTKFDFGSYVFEQTMKHANLFSMKMPIAFPSLICGVILIHHADILVNSAVANIIATYGKDVTSSTSMEGIIIELKDTCKALDETIESCTENKIRLESLIKALSKEDSDGKFEGDEEEEMRMKEIVDSKYSKPIIGQVQELQVLVNKIKVVKIDILAAFQVGAIIAKLPPSWKGYMKKLLHSSEDFSLEKL